ncbi:sigma-70 family RNA polymerase sigma factor [Ginsengibacter hankyongi]|uniref:Sigma-70 family RNA polymerase sigma factor n=1 Tax=Ginsengibacter hankyongi TaxID=2607284 RepID=A0A5J5IG41_9BACT|nr:sigma-70 family RNA polymerase sigma factor [Ginsengibacter hankyongi]KAA9039174.1 sigma-70 family RNA polymerase sigma factor [Ginsengibacter hankyongi]
MDYRKLVTDCIKGIPDAQRQLYEHFAPAMLGVCFRYTKSIADAEDVLQDGFVKVFKHLSSYKFEGELGGWIRKIMVNTALNFLKTNKKYQYDLSFSEMPLHPVSVNDPVIQLQTKELSELIRQLPTGFQTIFNLHAVEGYTHVEIASMLGISDGTSRSQYARARALLIGWIEKFSLKEQQERYGRK